MASDDQLWNLIERLTRLEEQVAALAQDGDTPGGGDVRLGKTTRIGATYPTGAGDYYAISPALPTGTEVEGTAAGTSVPGDGVKYLAAHIGPTVPPEGTVVLVHTVGARFEFFYG